MSIAKGMNGQQQALNNLEAFQVWASTQTVDDFNQIIFRGKLNRSEIAKAIGCGKSALSQNPAIRTALNALEQKLRRKGVLPPLTKNGKKVLSSPKQYDSSATRRAIETKRKASLEAENIELKAKVAENERKLECYKESLETENCELKTKVADYKRKLERYKELSQSLNEMGIMPR